MNAPVWFVSHGSPMLALGDGHAFARALRAAFLKLPEPPRAVVAVSAHWQTRDQVGVTAGDPPGVMHDFGGFPPALYALDHPAPGDPALTHHILDLLRQAGVPAAADPGRRLDHGVWSVLRHADPEARVPVVQVSLPRTDPATLVRLGEALAPLREDGVLLLASGGLVHNLGRLGARPSNPPGGAGAPAKGGQEGEGERGGPTRPEPDAASRQPPSPPGGLAGKGPLAVSGRLHDEPHHAARPSVPSSPCPPTPFARGYLDGLLDWEHEEAPVAPWAREAEAWILDRLAPSWRAELVDYRRLMPGSAEAAPTTEHLDPLFVALGAAGEAPAETFLDAWQHGTLSLRCLRWG